MKNSKVKNTSLILFGILALVSFFVPISPILGSFKFTLTGVSTVFPLIGGLASLPYAALFIMTYGLFRALTAISITTTGIPLFFATMNWNIQTQALTNKSRTINLARLFLQVVVPMICMALFVAHPVGRQAFVYSWFWLVPVALYTLEKLNIRGVFFTALSSTFIAHGIGTALWIYMVPMTAEQWIALIPVTLAERLVMAAASTLFFVLIKSMSAYLSSLVTRSRENI
ncbi:hypothetical protein K2X40_03875 [Candidatus Babeliales bacterium]|nr:hypothetical protein [Candidatus Babeliales bacterium]